MPLLFTRILTEPLHHTFPAILSSIWSLPFVLNMLHFITLSSVLLPLSCYLCSNSFITCLQLFVFSSSNIWENMVTYSLTFACPQSFLPWQTATFWRRGTPALQSLPSVVSRYCSFIFWLLSVTHEKSGANLILFPLWITCSFFLDDSCPFCLQSSGILWS